MSEPLRIFCGTEPKTYIAQKVLEHSIKMHTAQEVVFIPMIGKQWEYPTEGIKVGTGFSLRRWMIPAACNFEGRAVYMDADQLVFGDVSELVAEADRRFQILPTDPAILCTEAFDKYSPKMPVPQTSVMVMDCAALKWFSESKLEYILDFLRKNPGPGPYGDLMHAKWLSGRIGALPNSWNHLNVYNAQTRLLHYTKEPEQPWYKPDHPLAHHWETALKAAIADGFVTDNDLKEALARWNVKEDWRNTNGLHPHYARYLKRSRGAVPKTNPKTGKDLKPASGRVLWVTTFARDMFEPSGKPMLESFLNKKVVGDMLVAAEGVSKEAIKAVSPHLHYYDLAADMFLADWLAQHEDVIPQHLGGKHPGICTCPGGPFDPHDKRHTMPCIGHWFNRNASRWFRKIAAQRAALSFAELHNYDVLMWIDADSRFKQRITAETVQSFFKGPTHAMFYLKNKRPIMECGAMGFNLRLDGQHLIRDVVECYRTGDFKKMRRWDDSAVYQWFVDRATVPCVDIAYGVGEHAAVVSHSPLHPYFEHRKGTHGRKLGIMK